MKTDNKVDLYMYIMGCIVVGVVAILAAITLICGTGWLHKVPPCTFHVITGLYCPGCGGTRATFALFRGQVLRSLKLNPFVLYSWIVGGWFMISQTIQRLSFNRIRVGMRFRTIYLWIGLAVGLINCIIKNAVLLIANIALLG